jgi:uncharacterized Tic20 family protein
MRDDERFFAAISHAAVIIPFWGIVLAAGIWMYFKERSREVVFHAQQAIFFQVGALAFFLLAIVAKIFEGIVRLISDPLANAISTLNLFFLSLGFVAYAAVCLYGAYRTWTGAPFLYPIIGKRMAEGFHRPSGEE